MIALRDFQNELRVKVLPHSNLGLGRRISLPVTDDFRDHWVQDILNIEFVTQKTAAFGAEGFQGSDQLHRYGLKKELDKLGKTTNEVRKNPIFRCFSLTKHPQIIDLTCGQGKDALLLLRGGHKVQAYERNSLVSVYFLIELFKLWQQEPFDLSHFEYIIGDFFEDNIKSNLSKKPLEGSFYYDPMFIKNKKKAKARSAMQVIDAFTEDSDIDQDHNIQFLVEKLRGRLAIKRPAKSKCLIPATFQIESKLLRFDVYER